MGFSGNIGELDRIAADIRRGPSLEAIAAIGARGIRSTLGQSIAAAKTPYGEAWAPKEDGSAPDTGIGRRVKVTAVGNKIITETDQIAGYHHSGTSKMPARPLIPSDDRGLPPQWTKDLDAAVDSATKRGAA
jgi:hypothetical protein